MFIHKQMAKEKQNLLLVTFEKKWTKHVLNVTSSYNFVIHYATRKVQDTNFWPDVNGTQQVLAYMVNVDLIGDDIR